MVIIVRDAEDPADLEDQIYAAHVRIAICDGKHDRSEVCSEKLHRHGFRPPCFFNEPDCQPRCTSNICQQHFRSIQAQSSDGIFGYERALTDGEAQEEIAKILQSINSKLHSLSSYCSRYGNSILKRWKKMTSEERRILILEVKPDIYPYQWFIARTVHGAKFGCQIESSPIVHFREDWTKQNNHDACLLPYINLEGLTSQPSRLVSLLHNRTKYSPAQWAAYDDSILGDAWKTSLMTLTYHPSCIVMCGANYGQLAPWNREVAHSRRILGYPRGLLVLEAQQKLLTFLCSTVDLILRGRVQDDTVRQADKFIKTVSGGATIADNGANMDRFESVYLNQPYSTPPVFDIHKLVSLAKCRLDWYTDHLWLLQSDARYMRWHYMLSVAGAFKEHAGDMFLPASIGAEIMQDFIRYLTWQWIHDEVQRLSKFHTQYEHYLISDSDSAVPAEYSKCLARVDAFLLDQMKRRCSFLRPVIPLRPGFRDIYHISTFNNPPNGGVVIYPRRKISYPEPLARLYTDRMEYCLGSILWECGCKDAETHGGEHDRPFDMSLGFAMLDEHMGVCERNGNKKELARLDGNLYSLITDLSAVHQMHGMLQIHRPRPIKANLQDLMQNCEGRGWRYLRKHFLEEASYRYFNFDMENNTFTNIECQEQSEPMDDQNDAEFCLGKLLEAFLNAPQPMGPRNTQARLEAEDRQRASLHRFWAGIRERHAQICRRIGISQDDIDSDLKILSFDNDPDYLETIRIEREEILYAIAAKEAAKISKKNKRDTTEQEFWIPHDESMTPVFIPKTKVKTRGEPEQIPTSTLAVLAITESPTVNPEPCQVAKVNKRHLVVFKSIFPGHDVEARSKSIRWSAFVNAMGAPEVEFIARRLAGGSEHSFELGPGSKWAGMGSIVFHKPHPEEEIDAVELACWGKRMGKWFGWGEGSFELRRGGGGGGEGR